MFILLNDGNNYASLPTIFCQDKQEARGKAFYPNSTWNILSGLTAFSQFLSKSKTCEKKAHKLTNKANIQRQYLICNCSMICPINDSSNSYRSGSL